MTAHKPFIQRARVALLASLALLLVLSACEYRPEKGKPIAGTEETEEAAPEASTSGSPSPEKSNAGTVACPTEPGLTPCGIDPTNPPPKASGGFKLSTFAGSGTKVSKDGTGTAAGFVRPTGIALGPDSSVFVADPGASQIRKISKAGETTTLAGNGTGYKDGPGAQAKFANPRGLAVAADGTVYVADTGNHVIRVIAPSGGVSTLVGTAGKPGNRAAPGTAAMMNSPAAIALGPDGSLYVAEFDNHLIRLVSKTGKVVKTLAGTGIKGFRDGPAAKAQFDSPSGLGVDAKGVVYVADAANNRIRKIAGGAVSTLAGRKAEGFLDGKGADAKFNIPYGLTLDSAGNVFVTEFVNNSIRKIDPAGVVTTVFVSKKPPASLSYPAGLVWVDGRFYVADSENGVVRLVKR